MALSWGMAALPSKRARDHVLPCCPLSDGFFLGSTTRSTPKDNQVVRIQKGMIKTEHLYQQFLPATAGEPAWALPQVLVT